MVLLDEAHFTTFYSLFSLFPFFKTLFLAVPHGMWDPNQYPLHWQHVTGILTTGPPGEILIAILKFLG